MDTQNATNTLHASCQKKFEDGKKKYSGGWILNQNGYRGECRSTWEEKGTERRDGGEKSAETEPHESIKKDGEGEAEGENGEKTWKGIAHW